MKDPSAPRWSRLDNAGKLFASASSKADPRVMRFACELTEEVVGELLQKALEKNLRLFPTFRCTLRKGLFWYYLEESDLTPEVLEEHFQPCAPLYDRIRRGLLFNVSFYRSRINLEVHHALSDGTGVLQFLRMLVYHYLLLRHPLVFAANPPQMDFDATGEEQADDGFLRYYDNRTRPKKEKTPRGYHLRGPLLSDYRMHILSGVLSTKAALAAAKSCKTTLTAFLTAVLMQAIAGEQRMKDRARPVVITIPVNLRKYFQSESVRNFFGTFEVARCFREKEPLEAVISDVGRTFTESLTPERLAARMNGYASMEHNFFARIVPLSLKDFGLSMASRLSDNNVSAALSNIGPVAMPEELRPYIRLFDAFISTKKLQLCLCSFGDNLTLTITAPFVSTNVQKRFFRTLTGLGLAVQINSNVLSPEDLPGELKEKAQPKAEKAPRAPRQPPKKRKK